MSTRSNYQIIFQKSTNPLGTTSYYANTNNISNGQIAFHLENSSLFETQSQIADINDTINRYQSGLPIDEFWGDIVGSQLFVYPENNTVQLGNSILPISDFLDMLQEWEDFISS